MLIKMNRRKFLSYLGCSCGGFILNSCTSAPITQRKQLSIVPEAKLNAQAAKIYEKVKKKEKLSKEELMKFKEKWSPWCSIATWYMWRSLDPVPVEY